jgi:hypothetical protein
MENEEKIGQYLVSQLTYEQYNQLKQFLEYVENEIDQRPRDWVVIKINLIPVVLY